MRKLIYLFVFFLSISFSSCNTYGKKEEFYGTEVYYKKPITKEEVKKLGEFLVRSEFADGKSKSVQLMKNDETGNYVFRMVTQEKAQKEKMYEVLFKALAMQISDSVFSSQPVDFDVCNNRFETIKTISFKSK